MGNLGVSELILIFIVALIVFGPRRLPELGRTLGKALAEFRKHSTDLRMAFEEEMRDLERSAQEADSKVRDTLAPAPEPAALPEGPVGSGSIAPESEFGATPGSPIPARAVEEHPQEKPIDGDPKPA
ncbi:MAG TPA: twin-arginine translocase TatA/TatE family subunit [Candidatus Acidoferrales bacterium]|jgi:Tat protein translocase TatB subunit|nr:twin-arginine translocase TatA/TatE family subunit [Candidatus Acidoferrales bacterium]